MTIGLNRGEGGDREERQMTARVPQSRLLVSHSAGVERGVPRT